MNFNKHSRLEGQHAFLSASKYHWVNYTSEKLNLAFNKFLAAQKGTEYHEFASKCIKLGIKLPKTKKTLNLYVNDCIGFRMTPEQPLFYSENCFGTADAISFKSNFLRIFDLKTGETKTSFKQLEVYTALFFLEYNLKPENINVELRLYQSDDVQIYNPTLEEILFIMDRIVIFDKEIDKIKMGE